MKKDTYKTISKPSVEVLLKERKSKFYGYAYPINIEEDVKPIIDSLKKKYRSAGHACYAWQLGTDTVTYRVNDDGEPNNSAGMRIYGQIQAFNLTNILVVILRIYGGTKLGVGGLIQAYKTASQLAIESADIIEKLIEVQFQLTFNYPEMDKVMRIVKQENISIISQNLEVDCQLLISVRRNKSEMVEKRFKEIQKVKIKNMLKN